MQSFRACLPIKHETQAKKGKGYFPDWVTARMGVMEFFASGHGDTALTNDLTFLRGIQHLDAGPRHPASFVLCDKLIVG